MYGSVRVFTNEYCTGAAISFPASYLCSAQMPVITDKVQQYGTRGERSGNRFVIENELDQSSVVLINKVNIIDVMKPWLRHILRTIHH
jgi:hypothetical protein